MKPDVRKYLADILASIQEIETYVVLDKEFELYSKDRRSQLIAGRLLTVIGEQVARIVRIDVGIAISHTERITGFRNRVSHDYDMIDQALVYTILSRHIPILKTEVQALLNKASP
jgi:uncharacterized protein with HEPN domain